MAGLILKFDILKKNLYLVLIFLGTLEIAAQVKLTHNGGQYPLDTLMFTCVEEEFWARTYVLADFGIDTNADSYIDRGEIAFYLSYAGATARFNIYAIDENFPDSFPSATLLGSSQIEPIPYFNYPGIMQIYFDTPVTVPAHVERILVEVEKGDDPGSFFTPLAAMAGSEYENDYSYYKGCHGNVYKVTGDLTLPRPNANFVVNVYIDDKMGIPDLNPYSFSLYPNPSNDKLNIATDLILKNFKIYAITGNILMEGTLSETVDISSLNGGIYFFESLVDGNLIRKKFIKI